MIKKILFFVSIILIALFQISFISEFHFLKNNLNFVLVIIILFAFLNSYKSVLLFSFFLGMVMDFFSIFNFGFITIGFLLTVFLINLLFKRLITNKETYSLILVTIIGTITYNLYLLIGTNLFYIMNWNLIKINFSLNFLYSVIWQLIFHILLIVIMLTLIKFINKKLISKFFISKTEI